MTDLRSLSTLRGKTAVVTGGTSGIGKEIARRLGERGARLIIVGRDPERGARAENEIRAASHNDEVQFIPADLSLMRDTLHLGDHIASRMPALNFLVHSAGVVRGRRVMTAEGVESNFATNYLSRFALTNRLAPLLQNAWRPDSSARIVLISHPGFNGTIHYEDVSLARNFSTIRAFRQFHFANDLFATELARRLSKPDDQAAVTILSLHPGPTKGTNIDKEMPLWMKILVRAAVHPLASRTPDVPAAAALGLLLDREYEREAAPMFTLVGRFKRVPLSLNLLDPEAGKRLWSLSEKLVQTSLGRTAPISPVAYRNARVAAE